MLCDNHYSLFKSGADKEINLTKVIEYSQKIRKHLDLAQKDNPNYPNALKREITARRELQKINISHERAIENINGLVANYSFYREKFLKKNTPEYATTLKDEGLALANLADLGYKPYENLEKAIKLYSDARVNGFTKKMREYAEALGNEADARYNLVKWGNQPRDNLKKAIGLLRDARKEEVPDVEREFFKENTEDYAHALAYEGIAYEALADNSDKPSEKSEYLHQAIELQEKSREKGLCKGTEKFGSSLMDEANARMTLAKLYVQEEDDDPEDNINTAIDLFVRSRSEGLTENSSTYALSLMNEGVARMHLVEQGIERIRNLAIAERLYLEAKDIFEKEGGKQRTIKVINNLGQLKYIEGKMEEAYNYLLEAIGIVEGTRSSIDQLKYRKEYFATVVQSYKTIVPVCSSLSLKKDEFKLEAFKYAESAKSRTFLELLIKNIQEATEEITQPFLPNSIDIHEIKEVLNGKTLVEYFLGRKLIIFVINKNGDLIVKETTTDIKELMENVKNFRIFVDSASEPKNRDDETYYVNQAKDILPKLYNFLITPIKEHLGEEVVIIPHSYLHLIPFNALFNGERYLIQDYSLSFAQSALSLKFLKKGCGSGAVIVGNPQLNLPFSEEEATEIARYFSTKPIIGREATKGRVIKEMQGKKNLHFACHGDHFRICLQNTDEINAADFMNLKLDAELTVLSACNTALAYIDAGDEVEGIIRAVQYSGCRFVIGSLWPVYDDSTKDMFLQFYRESNDITLNLKNAQMRLLNRGHNFYRWAPFQIYGV